MTQSSSNSVVEIQNKAKEEYPPREFCRSIYMVPPRLKNLNEDAYKPNVVSFGPYHHDDDSVVTMEEHKQRTLLHFLERADKPKDTFLKSLKETLPVLMGSYEGLGYSWMENDCCRFLELMMVDGCFMLEIMKFGMTGANDYAVNDPIFSYYGFMRNIPDIRRDMVLVENQIPLLVLKKLLSVESGNTEIKNMDVNKLVLRFFGPNEWDSWMDLGLHPLDLYRKSLIHFPATKKKNKKMKSSHMTQGYSNENIFSAAELDRAGVKLKVSQTSCLRDITFENGVLRLPKIGVDDTTESMFLNLMAFEKLHGRAAGNEINSYVLFMDELINSARDASLLISEKIILYNALGSDKAVAKLFKSLSKDVIFDPDDKLNDVLQRVNYYCSKRHNTWRADLLRTYFRSPWAFISLAAAILILVLTVTQTVFTILQYYKDP